jgi:cell division protein FtsN
LAQDDYYYEIQLTNKQLVFYFMAAATGLILSFLAGVMVGSKSVETSVGEVQAARPAPEERIVAEDAPAARPSALPSAEDLTYAQRLESDKVEDTLDRGKRAAAARPAQQKASPAPAPPATPPPSPKVAAAAKAPATPAPTPRPSAAPSPQAVASAAAPTPPAVAPSASPAAKVPTSDKSQAKPAAGSFTIQVGAFKDKVAADSVVSRLKGKGFAAYVTSPEGADGGLFNVRVGSYGARTDAERVQAKLRDQEKFKPFIVKN